MNTMTMKNVIMKVKTIILTFFLFFNCTSAMQWSKKKILNGTVKLNPFCTEFHSQEPLDQMKIVLRNQSNLLPWNIVESGVKHHTPNQIFIH